MNNIWVKILHERASPQKGFLRRPEFYELVRDWRGHHSGAAGDILDPAV